LLRRAFSDAGEEAVNHTPQSEKLTFIVIALRRLFASLDATEGLGDLFNRTTAGKQSALI
jgi:hypothetical protein